jgi:hypothetical protein
MSSSFCAMASGIAAPPPLMRLIAGEVVLGQLGFIRKSITMVGIAVQCVTP